MATSRIVAHEAPSAHWLAQVSEPALLPRLPIVDPHHHLWDRDGHRYLLPEFLDDIASSGHRVVATVYVQARSMLREHGGADMAPVGETEFACGVAAMSASGGYGPTRVCHGIVAHADLRLGPAVEAVLQAHERAGGGRFRGIRHIATRDADPRIGNPALAAPAGLLGDSRFRAGFAVLDRLRLGFEAWAYHPQLGEVAALARSFPGTTIVLNHLGGVLNIGGYAGRREEIRRTWLAAMKDLADCPNVHVKLGGLGMPIAGHDYASGAQPPGSERLAADFSPYVLPVIELFGPARCMFESNFPVDKRSFGYGVLWNAFKRLAAGLTAEEREALFWRTAARVYDLDLGFMENDE